MLNNIKVIYKRCFLLFLQMEHYLAEKFKCKKQVSWEAAN